ncbi:hypothetical protein OF83DRAFT_285346 [Amylostereum chailletii]|nr:hypothetical protein OF83DRAFT_285346 [Amylostereum chailletii]
MFPRGSCCPTFRIQGADHRGSDYPLNLRTCQHFIMSVEWNPSPPSDPHIAAWQELGATLTAHATERRSFVSTLSAAQLGKHRPAPRTLLDCFVLWVHMYVRVSQCFLPPSHLALLGPISVKLSYLQRPLMCHIILPKRTRVCGHIEDCPPYIKHCCDSPTCTTSLVHGARPKHICTKDCHSNPPECRIAAFVPGLCLNCTQWRAPSAPISPTAVR